MKTCVSVSTTLLALLLLLPSTHVHGNGWEHGAIPFTALVKALEVEAPEMRRRAAESLGLRGQPEAIEPLLKMLARGEDNPHVRSAVYLALGRLGDRRSVSALMHCLDTETREELRSDCVMAFGMIGDVNTLPRLLEAREKDTSFLVQSSVVDALGHFSEPAAVEALAKLTASGTNNAMRQRALQALGRTGAPTAVKPLLQALAEPSRDSERLVIVDALTRLRPQAATAPLTALLQTTDAPELRAHLVMALGAIRDGNAYPTLLAMLTDPVPAVRYFAVRGLQELGRREAAVPIGNLSLEISRRLAQRSPQDMLIDPGPVLADLSFQVIALQALATLDAASAQKALIQAAQPHDIPHDSAVALKLAEGFYRQRRAALNGLGAIRSPDMVPVLAGRAGLQDSDFRLRAVAVRSLGRLGFPDATKTVLVALDDPQAEVRWTAASVLGRLGVPQAVAPLMAHLTDPYAEVRRQATLSLGYLHDHRAYDALRRLSQDDGSEAVREAAAYSLQLLAR